jgi:hypothetical protein
MPTIVQLISKQSPTRKIYVADAALGVLLCLSVCFFSIGLAVQFPLFLEAIILLGLN